MTPAELFAWTILITFITVYTIPTPCSGLLVFLLLAILLRIRRNSPPAFSFSDMYSLIAGAMVVLSTLLTGDKSILFTASIATVAVLLPYFPSFMMYWCKSHKNSGTPTMYSVLFTDMYPNSHWNSTC